jgi:hypothetical protein
VIRLRIPCSVATLRDAVAFAADVARRPDADAG